VVPQIHAPIRTWWFAELIDVRAPERANEIVDLAIESQKSAQNWGLAPHALFTASKNLYRRCEEVARRENVLLTTHLAESREEMEMFRDGSGPLYDFLKSIGRPMDDCGQETPLEQFLRCFGGPSVGTEWIVAHLNEVAETDFELLEKSNMQFHVVQSPRSHDYFGHSRFPFERLRSLGFNICLGTDSLASNRSLSLFAEMRAFRDEFPSVSPQEILQMVTANPAMALHQETVLGRIRPGFRADLISTPSSGTGNVFEEIIAFEDGVNWMLLNGKEERNTTDTVKVSR
jgi:cytosine/adenosine deaminase-related metal-dependent hydrolase